MCCFDAFFHRFGEKTTFLSVFGNFRVNFESSPGTLFLVKIEDFQLKNPLKQIFWLFLITGGRCYPSRTSPLGETLLWAFRGQKWPKRWGRLIAHGTLRNRSKPGPRVALDRFTEQNWHSRTVSRALCVLFGKSQRPAHVFKSLKIRGRFSKIAENLTVFCEMLRRKGIAVDFVSKRCKILTLLWPKYARIGGIQHFCWRPDFVKFLQKWLGRSTAKDFWRNPYQKVRHSSRHDRTMCGFSNFCKKKLQKAACAIKIIFMVKLVELF